MMDGFNYSLLKPNKRFPFPRYRLDVRARVGGIPKRKIETVTGSKREARERYFVLLAELKAGGKTIATAKTFGDLLARYKVNRGGEIPRSESAVYKAVERDLGAVTLRALPDALESYAGLLRASPSPDSGKRLAGGSINRRRALIAATLNLAVELGIMEKSPLKKALFPKQKEVPRDRYLSLPDELNLLNTLEREAPHLLPLTRFALQCPARKAELVGMRLEDLDMVNKRIRVRNGTTKSDRGCWKPIPPDMLTYFLSLPSGCVWLFYRAENGAFHPLGDFKKAWRRCLMLAGVTDFRFHDTRHMAVTRMADRGVPERQIMEVAGWKTNMMGTYYHHGSGNVSGMIMFAEG